MARDSREASPRPSPPNDPAAKQPHVWHRVPALAKTARPSLGRVLVRQRLFDQLDERAGQLVCVVQGPPGAGKTTLIASYVGTKDSPTIWYQVDKTDIDVASFFRYFSHSAVSAYPQLVLPAFTAGFEKTLELFVRQFARALCQGVSGTPMIVLDNWQEVASEAGLNEVLQWMCEELPAGSRVFILTRGEVPQSLGRLRAYGRVAVLNSDHLKLSLPEAKGLADWHGQDDPAEIEKLCTETDGWFAGFVLSLKGGKHFPSVGAAKPGSVLFDYFATEVLRKAQPDAQRALVRMSLLPRITTKAARALTGFADTSALLERLVKESHFTTRHGDKQPVYQFHLLFRSFLLAQCALQMSDSELADARRLAASILESEQDFDEAIATNLAISEWDALRRLLTEHATAMLEEGRHGTLLAWLTQIPEPVRLAEPWFAYWLGRAALPTDQALAKSACESAYRQFVSGGDRAGALLSWSGTASAIHNDLRGHAELDAWLDEFERTLGTWVDEVPESVKMSVAADFLTFLLLRRPGHPRLHEWAERVTAVAAAVEAPAKRIFLLSALLFYHTWCGSQARGGFIAHEIRALRSSEPLSPFASISGYIVEVTYYQHSGLKDATVAAVREAIALADATGIHIWDSIILGNAVAVCYGGNDDSTGDALFLEMERRMRGERAHDAGQFNLITAWRAARNKQFQAAERLSATSLDVLRAAGVPFFIAWALVEAAIISEWTGKAAKADDALDEASRLGETLSNQKITWASLMVRAILLFARNERTVGMDVLRRAFAIGSGSGFMHFFFFPPHEIASLCVYALDAGIEVDYALELIRRHDLRPPTGHPYTEEWPWPIKIFTMNRFAILRNGEPLAFNRKTQKRPLMLLKALIGRGGRDVKETDLADDLWPLAEGDAAHQALATTLFRLRKLVGEDIVLRLDGRLTLNANICWVDAWALEKQLSETQSDDPLAKARGIARLYAGPFESDDESAPWATPLRESLRHKAITALVDAGRALQQKARHRDAIEVFQHGLRLDDLVEEWYRGLMVSYAAENRRSEAIELYRQLAARLKSGLNMVPSKQTEVVYAIVSGRDASTRSPGG